MRANEQKQREERGQKGNNTLGAVVTGAVIGAGVVVAAQTALKSKENRKKLQGVADMAKDKAGEYANTLKDKIMAEKHVKKMLPKEENAKRAIKKATRKA